VVVVDPRRSRTAAEADEHHFIRPGTDALLLFALVHTLCDEGLIRTGRLAAGGRAAVYGRVGPCQQEFGTVASWLVDVLNVLTGNLDRPGGAMFTKAAARAGDTRGE